MTGDTRCELCDLPLAQCVHGAAARRKEAAPRVTQLEVSPRGIAHLPGCDHKDDDDYSGWGLVTTNPALAWQELGNHRQVQCDEGARPDLVALRRCLDCEARA